MPPLQPPPIEIPFFDERGNIAEAWKKFLLNLRQGFVASAAPADAVYVVGTANADLTSEINLGALASGWLRIAVSAGLATVTSLVVTYTAMEPAVDVTIPATMGAIVPDHFTIAAGKVLTIGPGAVFQIT